MGQRLGDIVAQHHQAYLTKHDGNVRAVEYALKRMGLGEEFDYVGSGDKAVVIAPTFTKEVVIRLCTEEEEPDQYYYNPLSGKDELQFRPQIPQVLQAIHTEKVPVENNYANYSKTFSTKMRVEVLPRLKTISEAERNSESRLARWEKYAKRLTKELWVAGYKVDDAKADNIGILENRTKSPVLLDPGEIHPLTREQKMFSRADIFSLTSSALRRHTTGYQWNFTDQTAHLKTDWKQHILNSISHHERELDDLLERMMAPVKPGYADKEHERAHARSDDTTVKR